MYSILLEHFLVFLIRISNYYLNSYLNTNNPYPAIKYPTDVDNYSSLTIGQSIYTFLHNSKIEKEAKHPEVYFFPSKFETASIASCNRSCFKLTLFHGQRAKFKNSYPLDKNMLLLDLPLQNMEVWEQETNPSPTSYRKEVNKKNQT